MTDDPSRRAQEPSSAWLRLSLAVMSLAAAAIHFAVIGEHFDEATAFGLFFAVVAWLQAAWAIAVVGRPSRALLGAGIAGNAAVVAVWVVSRTVGLPVGPDPGEPEAAAFIDVFATILETLIVAGGLVALVRPTSARWLRGRAGLITATALSLLVVPATTIAMATAGEHGEHESEGTHGDEEHDTGPETPEVQTIELGGGRTLEAFVDSRQPPTYQIHMTFDAADETELDVRSASVSATSETGADLEPAVIRLSQGHFVANERLEPGGWEFVVHAVTEEGEALEASFESHIEES